MSVRPYELASGAKNILRSHRLTSRGHRFRGAWTDQQTHAQCNAELIGFYLPTMSKSEQKRAKWTMKQLSRLYGVSI